MTRTAAPGRYARPWYDASVAEDPRASALRAYLAAGPTPCPKCGYDLRGTTSEACPECGHLLELVLLPDSNLKNTRWALLLAAFWPVTVNIVATMPFMNRWLTKAPGRFSPWWYLTTGWPSLLCAACLGVGIWILASGRSGHRAETQRRWLFILLALLVLQTVVSGVLVARWWHEALWP